MIGTADRVLKECERLIGLQDWEEARKCATGLKILTGQPAWERAYQSLIDQENPQDWITSKIIQIPDGLSEKLHRLHDEKGQEFPDQSVRGGTQVNLTHDPEIRLWLETMTGEQLIGAWTTRLRDQGFHVPHIHPRGENSHVLYIELGGTGGELYFGGARYLRPNKSYRIRPQIGQLVSFPCWLWHGVTPFHGTHRLAIAFDTYG